MLKIRQSHDRLIFDMGITIPRKDSLYIETGPWFLARFTHIFGINDVSNCMITITTELWQIYGHCPEYISIISLITWKKTNCCRNNSHPSLLNKQCHKSSISAWSPSSYLPIHSSDIWIRAFCCMSQSFIVMASQFNSATLDRMAGKSRVLWPLLLTRFHFNHNMDK